MEKNYTTNQRNRGGGTVKARAGSVYPPRTQDDGAFGVAYKKKCKASKIV